ncbi:50S ribosomal protein L19e [Candidatus Woesearchaeota archaeon]|nr:50S ribosomal protein L19e [Candidatus Woesearchaeota archaeon]|tara:strand:- start:1771 stop:2220 length:450 start_codon:yes stop_codon:yes gene_type:complete
MQLKIQKRLAAQILKSSESNIWLDSNRLDEIKEAITKADVKSLIKDKAIKAKKIRNTSKYRIRKNQIQKNKGRRRGPGSRKGSLNSRISKKRRWINHIRVQREFLQNLRDKEVIERSAYRSLYMKSKGGFFRSKRHLKIYMKEHEFIKK